jgi:hypothetical protein
MNADPRGPPWPRANAKEFGDPTRQRRSSRDRGSTPP